MSLNERGSDVMAVTLFVSPDAVKPGTSGVLG